MWFAIIFLGLLIVYLVWAINVNIKETKKNIQEKNNIQKEGNKYHSEYSVKINHVSGLPLAESSECILHLCNNQIVVETTSEIYKVQQSKIIDMNIKTSKEIQNSISGAVGGYMLLGALGAYLGGSSTEFHRFFIIVYKDKEDKQQYISFDMKDNLKIYKQIYNYIENFKNNIINKKEVEL